ncbi:MAG: hypothetical protein WA952_02145 [Lewinella sp.]
MDNVYLLALLLVGLFALIVWSIYYVIRYRRARTDTHAKLSDRDLLQRIDRQPDGFMTVRRLTETTQLNTVESRTRLLELTAAGILEAGYNRQLVNHFTLRQPLDIREPPALSAAPFLTVEDILSLFEHYDFRPRDQDLIVATGLPMSLIHREMKYFAAEGIVDSLSFFAGVGKRSQRTYVLKEPYRSQPDNFRRRAETDDLELKTILRNDNFIV